MKQSSPNLFDFFHTRLESAAHSQRADLSENGLYYLANLLADLSHAPDPTPPTLAEQLLSAQHAPPAKAITQYREVGDRALYLTGFFRRSLHRSLMGLSYYLQVGASAYSALSGRLKVGHRSQGPMDLAGVFAELSQRFETCSAVLHAVEQEVRAEGASSDEEIVRLYALWRQTGSPQAARRLMALGVVPTRGRLDEG